MEASFSLSEVVTFLKSITDDLSTDNIVKIFNSLDRSGDRSVDFKEFKVRLKMHWPLGDSVLVIFELKGVMIEIQNAGWKQCGQVDDKSQIQEEDILALFNMIDKDGSGSLTKRVSLSS